MAYQRSTKSLSTRYLRKCCWTSWAFGKPTTKAGILSNVIVILYRNSPTAKNGQVCRDEVSSIEAAYGSRSNGNDRLNVSFIAVSKDHNAQIRSPDSFDKDQKEQKIPAGRRLVITKQMDAKGTWEFVIQGHQSMKKDN